MGLWIEWREKLGCMQMSSVLGTEKGVKGTAFTVKELRTEVSRMRSLYVWSRRFEERKQEQSKVVGKE